MRLLAWCQNFLFCPLHHGGHELFNGTITFSLPNTKSTSSNGSNKYLLILNILIIMVYGASKKFWNATGCENLDCI